MNAIHNQIAVMAHNAKWLRPRVGIWYLETHNTRLVAEATREAAIETNILGSLAQVKQAAEILAAYVRRES